MLQNWLKHAKDGMKAELAAAAKRSQEENKGNEKEGGSEVDRRPLPSSSCDED